ncbi:UNVERIFIED_CONTAM: hypothetical protein GTU68_044113, partial [Idotea baltica]|nr:hypothetical protein [Idotea baltica]
MKFIVFACLLAVAVARPDRLYEPYSREAASIEIIRDDRVHPEGGSYSFDVETEDGIKRSESGSPLSIDGYPTGQQGTVEFPLPNGE